MRCGQNKTGKHTHSISSLLRIWTASGESSSFRDQEHPKALTSTGNTERDKYFAETFRGLGQLMQLVTDMSVPEHTRDDGHYLGNLPFYEHYEKWVKGTENVNIIPKSGLIFSYPPG